MIDKLPNLDREKAVMILKNSANHYYDLTLGQSLHVANVAAAAEYFNTPAQVQCQDVNNFPSNSLLDSSSSPFSPIPASESVTVDSPSKTPSKMESDAILAEISDLAGSQLGGCLAGDDNTAESESWDRHLDHNTNNIAERDYIATTSYNNYANVTPKCALCNRIFSCSREVTDHYQPVSCIGCKKELCNNEIFNIHFHSCKGIKHYQSKITKACELKTAGETHNKAAPINNDTDKNKKQIYKCHECSKEFVTAFQLNKHIKGHNDNNCDKCEAKFAKKRQLVHHLKTVHYISTAEKYYTCKFCPRKFVKKPSLWHHYSEHTVGNQVVCLKCGQILEDNEEMEKHIEDHKSNARHTCARCGEFFVRKQQYLAHIVGHDKYNCKICGKDFSSKKKLKLHKSVEHDPSVVTKPKIENNLVDINKDPKFTCVVCLQNYKNETLFKAHVCSKDGKKSEKIKTYAKDVTVKLPLSNKFKCKFCDFEHKKSSAVVRHARIHRNKKRFVCEQCGTAFNAHYTLKEHRIYVHSEARNYPCSKCDKTFKARNALIRHEQVHSDKRPFSCHCGQTFKRSSHLKRHVATSHKGMENESLSHSQQPTERSWVEDAGDSARFKQPTWDGSNKYGIPASVALDVVTSLDLNMRSLETKQDKDMMKNKFDRDKQSLGMSSCSERDKEDRDGHTNQSMYHDYRLGYSQHGAGASHNKYQSHMGHPIEQSARYYPGPGPSINRSEKDFDLPEKLYSQPHSSSQDKMYLSPPGGNNLDRGYPLEDRGFSHNQVPRNCDETQLVSVARSSATNLDPLFSDSGPADLSVSSSRDSHIGQYNRSQANHPSRHRYSNYVNTQSSTRSVPYQSHSYLRLQDYSRHSSNSGQHVNPSSLPSRNIDPVTASLDALDSQYRPLPELGYSQSQPTHYFDALDRYLPHSREDMELATCDKKKLFKTDKYYRGDHQDLMTAGSRDDRDESGLLPPLLALAPHHQTSSSGPSPPSPQNIKIDSYLQTDHLTSQYMQDGTLDYNNISEY